MSPPVPAEGSLHGHRIVVLATSIFCAWILELIVGAAGAAPRVLAFAVQGMVVMVHAGVTHRRVIRLRVIQGGLLPREDLFRCGIGDGGSVGLLCFSPSLLARRYRRSRQLASFR